MKPETQFQNSLEDLVGRLLAKQVNVNAAEEANALVVREGIPFREAYRRVGAKLAPGPAGGRKG